MMINCSSPKQNAPLDLSPEFISPPFSIAGAEPFLYADDSVIYLSWIDENDSSATMMLSHFENNNWTSPTKIASGNSWFINWADYPTLASNGKNIIAHYLDKSGEDTYAYDVKFTMSHDGGVSWGEATVLNEDQKQAEHGFVSMLPYGENFFVAWLDGRNTVMEGMEHHEGHHGSMSLRAAILDRNGKKINEWELDKRTCDCCQTTAAITSEGPVVIYRDRSDTEIRDMSIVRLVGDSWTSPKSIHGDNWEIAGCPVNGPRSSASDKTLAVAWYSVASDSTTVKVVFSENSGESFGEPIMINEKKSIGRVDIALIDDNTALVTWMEGRELKLAKVGKDGSKSSSITLATSSDARSSGFPQLAVSGNTAVFAWTDDSERIVKTASVKL